MTIYAQDLKFPFDTDMRNLAERECDPTRVHQFRVPTELLDIRVLELLKDRNIVLSHVEAFHTPANGLLSLHVDGPEINNNSKINWCYGARGSKMMWWRMKKGVVPTLMNTSIGTRYLKMEPKDCIPVHSAAIIGPTLVNAGVPHSVFNPTSERRWVLSLVLWDAMSRSPLQMEDAVQRLREFLPGPTHS
jgi:hypothetical protein